MSEKETKSGEGGLSRRTVLKTAGAGTVGGAMLADPAVADKLSAEDEDDQQMQTYLILFEHTVEGKENIEGVPTAVEEAQPLLERLDAETQGLYFGSIGEYDGFGIATFPNRENAEIFRLTLARDRTHEFEVYRIWPSEEYFGLIEQATD